MLDQLFGTGFFEVFMFIVMLAIIYLLVNIERHVRTISNQLDKSDDDSAQDHVG